MRWPRYYEGPNKDEYIETGRERYSGFDLEGRAFILMHTTSDNYNYQVISVDADYKESDDVGGLLEEAFHFIIDGAEEEDRDQVLYRIMTAMPIEELDESYTETDEYVNLDLGYIIPGLIDMWEVLE